MMLRRDHTAAISGSHCTEASSCCAPIGFAELDTTTSPVRTLAFDQLAVAAEAIAFGSAYECHWQTLAAFAARDGIDLVAEVLAQRGGVTGPTREWWRCTLLLSTELSVEYTLQVTRALIEIEDAGGGPAFNVERHALQVSATMRWLQDHVKRLYEGSATQEERMAAEHLVQVARMARVRATNGK